MSNQTSKYENFTNLLTDPKLKLTSKWRRRAQGMRGKVLLTGRQEPKDPMLKLTNKIEGLPAGRLVRFIQQSARRAATARNLLAKMHPDSVFRRPIEEQQKFNLVAFVAATTELENRGKIQEAY